MLWTILLWVILHAPQIYAIVKEIIDLIRGLSFKDRRGALIDLLQAYRKMRETNDPSELNALHSKLCAGRVCSVKG